MLATPSLRSVRMILQEIWRSCVKMVTGTLAPVYEIADDVPCKEIVAYCWETGNMIMLTDTSTGDDIEAWCGRCGKKYEGSRVDMKRKFTQDNVRREKTFEVNEAIGSENSMTGSFKRDRIMGQVLRSKELEASNA
ncbi:hypothetical protein Tco_0533690 [Tanacetum coccineum]